jgi:hypothetical protein
LIIDMLLKERREKKLQETTVLRGIT